MAPVDTIPSHLNQTTAQGLTLNEPIAQYELGSLRNFVYLIIDWKQKKAGIVDPQKNLDSLLDQLKAHQITLDSVLLTHTHFDHVAGLAELIKKNPQIPIHVHPHDAHRIQKKHTANWRWTQDKQTLFIGSLSVHVLHTPGHSAGECCFYLEKTDLHPPYLFTGDTLFIRDCGRTDLETGSNEEMFHSLQKIKQLPDPTIILPGHHYTSECASTLSQERFNSPPLRCQTIQELSELP